MENDKVRPATQKAYQLGLVKGRRQFLAAALVVNFMWLLLMLVILALLFFL